MKRRLVVIMLLLILSLSGCGLNSTPGNTGNNVYSHSDTFVKLDVPEESGDVAPVENTQTSETENESGYRLEGDYLIDENGNETYWPTPTDVTPSDHESYNSMYESNILVEEGYNYFDFTSEDWFNYTELDLTLSPNMLASIAYSVSTYYEGNVPCGYSFDSEVDTVETYTNMIHDYVVHADGGGGKDLLIRINNADNIINVSER